MSDNILLHDFIKVSHDPTIQVDAQGKDLKSSKSLLITFDLSAGGKRINNRIYQPKSQEAGVSSWTQPYPKPILVYHDQGKDPIGRIVDMKWVSLEREALDHLGSPAALIDVKRAFDSRSAKNIYKTMKKYDLLADKKWPGLSKLVATAKITDADAQEKFMNQSYMTFSAGSVTDQLICMVDGSEWHKGEICEHRPGSMDEEGNLAVFMTGIFEGQEASVVNTPAYDNSIVRHMQLATADSLEEGWNTLTLTDEAYSCTDSVVSSGDGMLKLEDLQTLDVETLIKAYRENLLGLDLIDALNGTTQVETMWLIRIHDALHHEYDWSLPYDEKEQPMHSIPTDIFKLHGALHDIAMAKDFRGSLINGRMDHFDSKGMMSEEYKHKSMDSQEAPVVLEETVVQVEEVPIVVSTDAETEVITQVDTVVETEVKTDAVSFFSSLNAMFLAMGGTPWTDGVDSGVCCAEKSFCLVTDEDVVITRSLIDSIKLGDAVKEQLSAVVDAIVEKFQPEVEVDWYLLDLALEALVPEDAKLSTEKRENLEGSAFCGPERSFPVPDCAHYTAAKKLIGRYKGPGDKGRIMACIERKGKSMKCDGAMMEKDSAKPCSCKDKPIVSTEDYALALQRAEQLSDKLAEVLGYCVTMKKVELNISDDSQKLDLLLAWFDNRDEESVASTVVDTTESAKEPLEHIKPVENPSVDSSEGKPVASQLDGFTKAVLESYQSILDTEGKASANRYLQVNKRYLPPSLDLSQLLN